MHYDLGFFDDQCSRVECAPNPFSAKVSAMSPAQIVSDVTGTDPVVLVGAARFALSLQFPSGFA